MWASQRCFPRKFRPTQASNSVKFLPSKKQKRSNCTVDARLQRPKSKSRDVVASGGYLLRTEVKARKRKRTYGNQGKNAPPSLLPFRRTASKMQACMLSLDSSTLFIFSLRHQQPQHPATRLHDLAAQPATRPAPGTGGRRRSRSEPPEEQRASATRVSPRRRQRCRAANHLRGDLRLHLGGSRCRGRAAPASVPSFTAAPSSLPPSPRPLLCVRRARVAAAVAAVEPRAVEP